MNKNQVNDILKLDSKLDFLAVTALYTFRVFRGFWLG